MVGVHKTARTLISHEPAMTMIWALPKYVTFRDCFLGTKEIIHIFPPANTGNVISSALYGLYNVAGVAEREVLWIVTS